MTDSENKRNGFNWGKGLLIVIAIFICSTLGIVVFLSSLDFEMVTENHYRKAVNYEEHIKRLEHTNSLSEPVEIILLPKTKEIQIYFPSSIRQKNPAGTVSLYRPSNSSLDQEIELSLDEKGMQRIQAGKLAKGKWLVKINWTTDTTAYFKEESVFL